MELEESGSLTLDYATELQSSKQCGPGAEIEIKTNGIGQKDQWNRIESPEINPCTYSKLIYDKRRQHYTMEKSLFDKWCWENWTATCKEMNLEHSLTPYTKTSSKWITDLNVIPDTIKVFKENIGRTLFDVNCSNIFFNLSPRVMEINKIKC